MLLGDEAETIRPAGELPPGFNSRDRDGTTRFRGLLRVPSSRYVTANLSNDSNVDALLRFFLLLLK
jgi:hypothetical protein